MVSTNYNNKTVLTTLALMMLSLSVGTSIAISTPHFASAQGVFEGLEREQSGEALPGDQPADIGGPAPLNATTTIEGSAGNATNATMTGAGNATNATMTGAGNATNATMTGAGNATNATMTGAGNATNATMTGAGNATNAGDGVTTAGSNQTGGSPLDAITDPIQDLFGGGGG
jgi:hypothetical protein